ncbi:MAG: type II toxin-antitoxin system VapB family antitoxin [Alphaproteobacteria bacterium]|jgi:Arc/MetJ family transcription regulator|nr:type II toxin-antitoxin system VapB family antitoxin [Alphaproteobacteria bacterium]
MRTTVTIDDELLARAKEVDEGKSISELVEAGLKLLIARDAQKRLALLAGTAPDLEAPPRRRFPPE